MSGTEYLAKTLDLTKLRTIREKKDISRFGASMKSGVFYTSLQRIETGKTVPSLETLSALAKAYGYRDAGALLCDLRR